MKKKAAAFLMVGMMIGGMVLPVSAADDNKDMKVTYGVEDTYTLSIPASVTLREATGTTEKLGVEQVNIQPGKVLNIKITSDSALLKREGDQEGAEKKVTSSITVEDVEIKGATANNPIIIGSYKGTITQETKNQTITFAAPADADGDNIIDAGTYKGAITFTAAIEDEAAGN